MSIEGKSCLAVKKPHPSRSAKTRKRIAGHLKKSNRFAAGIDIGSKTQFVVVPEKQDE